MLWGELPSSLEGTEQQAKSSALQWPSVLWLHGLCSAWSRKSAERTPWERGQHKTKIQGRDWALEAQLATWQKLSTTTARAAWPKSREGDDLLTYLFFFEKTLFSSNHRHVLGRTKDMVNASSSAGSNLPDNGVAHIYAAWHPHVVSPVAQTRVSMRVHASLETIPSPNSPIWQLWVFWPSATGITGFNPQVSFSVMI